MDTYVNYFCTLYGREDKAPVTFKERIRLSFLLFCDH